MANQGGGGDLNTLLLLRGDSSVDVSTYNCTINLPDSSPKITTGGKFDKCFNWDGSVWFTFDVLLPKIISGEFTVECWVYPTTLPSNGFYITICDFCDHRVLYYELFEDGLHQPAYFVGNGGSSWLQTNIVWATIGVNIQNSNWYHIALVGDGTKVHSYINGVRTNTSVSYPTFVNNKLRIGNIALAMNRRMRGKMSEFRVSDIARYSGNSFTPPTEPFTT